MALMNSAGDRGSRECTGSVYQRSRGNGFNEHLAGLCHKEKLSKGIKHEWSLK